MQVNLITHKKKSYSYNIKYFYTSNRIFTISHSNIILLAPIGYNPDSAEDSGAHIPPPAPIVSHNCICSDFHC